MIDSPLLACADLASAVQDQTSLDKTVEALLEALVRIRDESGVAMILVEQKADLALSFAAEAAVIDRGKIVYRGSSAALRNDAALQAQFLGVGGDERK